LKFALTSNRLSSKIRSDRQGAGTSEKVDNYDHRVDNKS
jgi:hypothetical protein